MLCEIIPLSLSILFCDGHYHTLSLSVCMYICMHVCIWVSRWPMFWILAVSRYPCPCRVWCPCWSRCFIDKHNRHRFRFIYPYFLIPPFVCFSLGKFQFSGVAIGSGWQAIVAYVNLGSYYAIGLTVGCVLGFKTSLGVAVSSKHFSH